VALWTKGPAHRGVRPCRCAPRWLRLAAGHLPEVMIMPGEARTAPWLPRMARLLMSRNDLRRSSDRIEGAVVATLLAAFLAAIVTASFIGARIYQSERAAEARLRPAVAVLSQNGPSNTLAGFGEARARWRAPDGRQRSGTLTTDIAPGIWDAVAGTRIRIWVTSSGDPVAQPGQAAMILTALLVPLWGAGGAALVLILFYWLCRLALDQRRLAAWEAAWALTGPRWTSRR
jgi:hypothetical protein